MCIVFSFASLVLLTSIYVICVSTCDLLPLYLVCEYII